jgi:hypothetical protein
MACWTIGQPPAGLAADDGAEGQTCGGGPHAEDKRLLLRLARRGREPAAVSREHHAEHRSAEIDLERRCLGSDPPDPDPSVLARGGYALRVGRERDVSHRALVAEDRERLSVANAPDLRGAVVARAAEEKSVRREGDIVDVAGVVEDRADGVAGRQRPDAHVAVGAAGRDQPRRGDVD